MCKSDNKVLLYSTGNYIQYPIIIHNGKDYEKEYIRQPQLVWKGTTYWSEILLLLFDLNLSSKYTMLP